MTARDVARRVLSLVDERGQFASAALAKLFETESLAARDRALATELVYGVLRHRSRLDRALVGVSTRGKLRVRPRVLTVLRVAAYQLLLLDRVPPHAAVDDAVRVVRELGGKPLAGFANGLLRALVKRGEPALPDVDTMPLKYAEVALSLPRWIVEQLPRDNIIEIASGLTASAPLSIRVNSLRATREDVVASLGDGVVKMTVDAAPDALLLEPIGEPSAVPSFRNGQWTVQDVASQRVSLLCAPKPGERMLDACAGVGGKATHIAALVQDVASIDAVDISARKLNKLRSHAQRLGVTSIRPIEADIAAADAPLADDYDLVLVDAPCTGLGTLRRHPEAKWRGGRNEPTTHGQVQLALLTAASQRVAPGGRLVYAVCTFTAEETSQVVAAFTKAEPTFVLDAELRTWPHSDHADAFYAARFVRRDL